MSDGKVDLSKFDNRWYRPGAWALRALWFVVGRIAINTYLPLPIALKRAVLRLFGARLGRGVVIKPKVNVKYPWFLSIGDHAWIGEGVWIDNLGKVSIGDHAVLSQGCMLLSGNHDYTKPGFDLIVREIALEAGVWIGARAIVCPGVTAKSHAMLTAGSVATEDLEGYGIYQGNPAVRIRSRVIGGA